jgi:hypothetical protein
MVAPSVSSIAGEFEDDEALLLWQILLLDADSPTCGVIASLTPSAEETAAAAAAAEAEDEGWNATKREALVKATDTLQRTTAKTCERIKCKRKKSGR